MLIEDCLIDAPMHPIAPPPPWELTSDGCQPVAEIDDPSCCPPPLCGNDLCCTFVAFMNLLPSGPLWDYWKAAAISYFESDPDDPSQCPLLQDPRCPSLVLHAIYTVLKLRTVVHGALWPALRESNPVTAITTLDFHLSRMQWEDCYSQHCREVLTDELTPLEVWTECGPMFCPPDYPPELENALKHNVAVALTRANMGVIKNLCGINWIIEPLGAELKPIYVYTSDNPCALLCTDNPQFEICNSRDWIEGAAVRRYLRDTNAAGRKSRHTGTAAATGLRVCRIVGMAGCAGRGVHRSLDASPGLPNQHHKVLLIWPKAFYQISTVPARSSIATSSATRSIRRMCTTPIRRCRRSSRRAC